MFPYEDSKIVSVRTPRKEITLVLSILVLQMIDTSMEMSSRVLQHETQKFEFIFKKRSKLNFYFY